MEEKTVPDLQAPFSPTINRPRRSSRKESSQKKEKSLFKKNQSFAVITSTTTVPKRLRKLGKIADTQQSQQTPPKKVRSKTQSSLRRKSLRLSSHKKSANHNKENQSNSNTKRANNVASDESSTLQDQNNPNTSTNTSKNQNTIEKNIVNGKEVTQQNKDKKQERQSRNKVDKQKKGDLESERAQEKEGVVKAVQRLKKDNLDNLPSKKLTKAKKRGKNNSKRQDSQLAKPSSKQTKGKDTSSTVVVVQPPPVRIPLPEPEPEQRPDLELHLENQIEPEDLQEFDRETPNNIEGNQAMEVEVQQTSPNYPSNFDDENFFEDFRTRHDDSTINTEPFFEGIEREVEQLHENNDRRAEEIDLTDLFPMRDCSVTDNNSRQSLNILDDSRSHYEIIMRNNEWKILSQNQRRSYEKLHQGMMNSRRNFQLLHEGKLENSKIEIFDQFLDLLESKELMSISAEILMTTKFGVLLNQIRDTLIEMKLEIPKNHAKVIQTVELIIEVMKDKITNTFVIDENLAEKYNTRKISDRLLGKRSPLKHITSGSQKHIKTEFIEEGSRIPGGNSIDCISAENEIEEILNLESPTIDQSLAEKNIKQEPESIVRSPEKRHSDFIKQLIGRIDYSLIINEENQLKNRLNDELLDIDSKKQLFSLYEGTLAIKQNDELLSKARMMTRSEIENIYFNKFEMKGKDPRIYAYTLEKFMYELYDNDEVYERVIKRFLSYIKDCDLTPKEVKRLSYLSLNDLRMTLVSFNVEEAVN